MAEPAPMVRKKHSFDEGFYEDVISRRESFETVFEYEMPRGSGYGFRVGAGQVWRLTVVEGTNALDVCVMNPDDPTEHYFPAAQIALEGGRITKFTRVWGTPPRSRPLCTCLADTVRWHDNGDHARDHISHAAHCNAHHWVQYAGVHPRTCYDNLRAGMAMMGFGQCAVHDNLNLFYKVAIEPRSGDYVFGTSDAEVGDYIEFYAEIEQVVAVSICPYGDGTVEPQGWREAEIPVYPLRVSVFETGIAPRAWQPYGS